MPINFIKFHGLGNDYIVIEDDQLTGISDLGDFAKRICNRHYGAGSDGIAIVGEPKHPEANFNVRIFNPDGSEANLSGNGTRCAVAYLYYKGLWSAEHLNLSTRSGIKKYTLLNREGDKFLFESDLGVPGFTPASIPMDVDPSLAKVIDYPVTLGDETFPMTGVQVGNPVACIFVNDFNELEWRRIGKALEVHPIFPERANIVFVRVENRERVELRIWERGVGETTASGSCSCGGALSSMIKDKTDHEVTVVTEGGEVKVKWQEGKEVVITGTAALVYSGQWPE
jgi:diaminopimelate epimerase